MKAGLLCETGGSIAENLGGSASCSKIETGGSCENVNTGGSCETGGS